MTAQEWLVFLLFVGAGIFNFSISRRPPRGWFFLGLAFLTMVATGDNYPTWYRWAATVVAAICFIRSALAKKSESRYIISRSGWKYPVSPELKRNPRIRHILELNDQRTASGQGSLSAMSQIAAYLDEDPDPEVRQFAAKALAVWPSLYVPVYLREALRRDGNKHVRLTCLSILEEVFDSGLGFFRVQPRIANADIKEAFDETINALKPLTENDSEDSEIRERTSGLLDEMISVSERLESRN